MSRRLSPFIFSLFLISGLIGGCIEVNPPPPEPDIPTVEPGELLKIGIESSLRSFQPILEDRINQADSSAQLTLFVSGSLGDLQEQLLAGDLDGIFVYQKPENDSLWTMPVALDSISIIVHPDTVVTNLMRSDLQQIFAGDVANWQAWTGQDQLIARFVMSSESGIQALFNERVMENRPFDASAVVPLDQSAMIEMVTETAGGIGFIPTSSTSPNMSMQVVPVDSLFPQFNTVRSQQYPLSIPIYLATLEEPQGEMRVLAAWLQSVEGQQALSSKFVQIGN